jgi:hypothetical protein
VVAPWNEAGKVPKLSEIRSFKAVGEQHMPIWSALILCTILLSTAVASDGPTMIMKAAEQAAYADALIQSCHYDEAEHWIDKALHNARDTRSDSSLVRDTAGTFVGHLEIKVREFRDQRKSWERTARDARQLLASNRLESARQSLNLTDAPSCDPAFRDLFNEIERRDTQVASLVKDGDQQLTYSPRSALSLYLKARSLNVEMPGLEKRMADAKNRIPHRCVGCTIAKVVLFTAVAGGLGYYGYQGYERQQQKAQATSWGSGR